MLWGLKELGKLKTGVKIWFISFANSPNWNEYVLGISSS